jgi:hypothetical protein
MPLHIYKYDNVINTCVPLTQHKIVIAILTHMKVQIGQQSNNYNIYQYVIYLHLSFPSLNNAKHF